MREGGSKYKEEEELKNSLKRLDPPRILITPSPDEQHQEVERVGKRGFLGENLSQEPVRVLRASSSQDEGIFKQSAKIPEPVE